MSRMALPVVGIDLPAVPQCSGNHGGRRDEESEALHSWRDRQHTTLVCPQCDGRHAHQWVRCEQRYEDGTSAIVDRCLQCGAVPCGRKGCWERRGHLGPHTMA